MEGLRTLYLARWGLVYAVPWGHCTAADAGHRLTLRERSDLEKRLRDQISALNTRVGELDSENRKLRETKYELDTKVGLGGTGRVGTGQPVLLTGAYCKAGGDMLHPGIPELCSGSTPSACRQNA